MNCKEYLGYISPIHVNFPAGIHFPPEYVLLLFPFLNHYFLPSICLFYEIDQDRDQFRKIKKLTAGKDDLRREKATGFLYFNFLIKRNKFFIFIFDCNHCFIFGFFDLLLFDFASYFQFFLS